MKMNNSFIKEMLVAWSNVTFVENPSDHFIHNQII